MKTTAMMIVLIEVGCILNYQTGGKHQSRIIQYIENSYYFVDHTVVVRYEIL